MYRCCALLCIVCVFLFLLYCSVSLLCIVVYRCCALLCIVCVLLCLLVVYRRCCAFLCIVVVYCCLSLLYLVVSYYESCIPIICVSRCGSRVAVYRCCASLLCIVVYRCCVLLSIVVSCYESCIPIICVSTHVSYESCIFTYGSIASRIYACHVTPVSCAHRYNALLWIGMPLW